MRFIQLKLFSRIVCSLVALCLLGSSNTLAREDFGDAAVEKQDFSKRQFVREEYSEIWFTTNRTLNTDVLPSGDGSSSIVIPRIYDFDKIFSSEINVGLRAGEAVIEFPADRGLGEQTYSSGARNDNPLDNFTITQFDVYDSYNDWLEKIKQNLDRNKDLANYLMYIHGFNQNFNTAVATAAQLKSDLKFKGPMLLFSWPSDLGKLHYKEVENRERISVAQLTQVLETIDSFQLQGDNSAGKKFGEQIIAHSMGARLALDTLNGIHSDGNKSIKLRTLILASPDVSRSEFVSRDLPMIQEYARKIFITCSNRDLALVASEMTGNDGRLGLCDNYVRVLKNEIRSGQVLIREFEGFPRELAGHSYFLYDTTILHDMEIQVNDLEN